MTTPSGQQVPLPPLSSRDRDGMTVVNLRGELDFSGSSVLQEYLSDMRRPTRLGHIADLTGLAYIDCACLTVLARHCQDIRSQGGSFALAAPHGAVRRILALTGLLTWFEVYDTIEEAASRTGTQSSPVLPPNPARARRRAAAPGSGTLMDTDMSLSSRPAIAAERPSPGG